MAKIQPIQSKKNPKTKSNPNAWIQMRTGLIIICIISIAIGLFMGWTVYQIDNNFSEGILWGLGFGGAIWVIFFIALYFNRFVRGNR